LAGTPGGILSPVHDRRIDREGERIGYHPLREEAVVVVARGYHDERVPEVIPMIR
jgi:hypothetical protein